MPMRSPARRAVLRRQAGFTMLEILVSLMIIALGVLGTAGLQALSLKINQGGQLRSQAVVLGLDFVERIEANNVATIAGKYAPGSYPSSASKDCAAAYCTPDELATWDLVDFKARVLAQLPGAAVTVTNVATTGVAPVTTITYTVRIDWTERISKARDTTVDTTGSSAVTSAGGGKTETFSYSITRTYQNRALVV